SRRRLRALGSSVVAVKDILLDTNAYVACKQGTSEAGEVFTHVPRIGINSIVLGELLSGFAIELIVGIWQKHRKIKEKESNISDSNRPPSSGSTGRWIHNPKLPPLRSFTIVFRPKSLVKPSTVTLNLIYTDLRKAPNLNSHSSKSLITSC